MQSASTMFSFRLPDDLRRKLEEHAEEEDRTLSNLIVRILKEAERAREAKEDTK